LIKVAVVADIPSSREFLERRVGGILKNIATVRTVLETELHRAHCDMIIAHHLGGRIKDLQLRFKHIPIIAIEPSIMPIGVKMLLTSIRSEETIVVAAEHQRCANKLLGEIIEAGILNCRYVSSRFRDIDKVDADWYITSEEMSDGIPEFYRTHPKMIIVPRMISQESSTQIISLALELASRNRGGDARALR